MRLKTTSLIAGLAACAFLTILLFSGCASGPDMPPEVPSGSGALTITFEFNKQSGHASNQFAVWVEDAEGCLVKTLYATRFTANGGYRNRPDSIPEWVGKSGLSELGNIDAITGSTPKPGALSYVWDLTDAAGTAAPEGTYRFCVEGSLRWRNRVLYSGEFEVGGGAASIAAEAQFFYEASEGQPALDGESPENGMITAVSAEYAPPGKP